MRNESLPYKREAPCSPNYPQNDVTYPKLNNGNCTVLYNLQYLCQMSGFSEDYPDQLWRFASAMFLHSGIIHLLLIILLQKYKGLKMEEQIGYLRMGVIYITCGISGNLLSCT
jgi:membrane associated rhomboid family serine protease